MRKQSFPLRMLRRSGTMERWCDNWLDRLLGVAMSRPRRRLAAVITFSVTLVLVAALGSPLAGDRLSSRSNALLARLISGVRFPHWTLRPAGATLLEWLTPVIADILLAILVGAVAMLIVSARTRLPALLAGWGLTMVLAAALGAGRAFALAATGQLGSAGYGSAATAITAGLWFGLITGWLNGVIVACAVRKTAMTDTAEDKTAADDAAGVTVAEPVRIWSPTQPDWQHTQDLQAVTSQRFAGPPFPTQSMQRPAGGPPFPAAGQPPQPWPPAAAPGS